MKEIKKRKGDREKKRKGKKISLISSTSDQASGSHYPQNQ